jgi:hypothetical protein
VQVSGAKIRGWKVSAPGEDILLAKSEQANAAVKVALVRHFEFKLPLAWLLASPVPPDGDGASRKAFGKPLVTASAPVASKLRLRFSLWQNGLPVDALPVEGWIELQLLSEEELVAMA